VTRADHRVAQEEVNCAIQQGLHALGNGFGHVRRAFYGIAKRNRLVPSYGIKRQTRKVPEIPQNACGFSNRYTQKCLPTILVTGGAGYIGSHTRYFLQKQGYRVIVADSLERGYRDAVPAEILHTIRLQETPRLADLMRKERVDAVIHFAAYIAVGESTKSPLLYFSNNVGGSLSLFEAMLQVNVRRIVFSSTAAAYGIPATVPITEDQPYSPINPYGESKVMVEKVLESLDHYQDFRSIRLRYFNACGAEPEAGLGEKHDPETHLIPLILRAVLTGEPVTLFGDDYATPDGTCIRDYIHVSDLAEAHIFALEHLLQGGGSDVFNVGTGHGHSVREVVAAVEEVTGQKVPFRIGPRREGDPPALVADSTKLQKTLGWHPQRAELKRIVSDAWAFAQRVKA
jgi:UDP-glucose-4-epimerase GalE